VVNLADGHPTATKLRGELEQLEAAWNDLGAGIASRLRPGLSDAEMNEMAEPFGLSVPLELRVWWNWHDGADFHAEGIRQLRTIGPGGFEFLPLEEALREYEQNRRVPVEPAMPDMYWHPSWLPFMRQDAQRLYIDCDRTLFGEYSPVRLVTWEWENYDVDRATSLTHAVSLWQWLLTAGYYRWDPADRRHWICDFGSIPLFARRTGLA
jgi:cell wall assembly regulator SMI1